MKWSYSAATSFLLCPRRWIFSTIAHHAVHDPLRREAHVLRQLTTPWAWLGKLVHVAIIESAIPAIRGKGRFRPDTLIAETLARAERQEAFSRARRYRTDRKTESDGNFLALEPHENGEELSPDEREMVRERLKGAIENLANLDKLIGLIYRSRACWLERRIIWRLDGTVVEATPDLILIDSSGRPVVVDWKVRTAGTSTAGLQLEVYGNVLLSSEQLGRIAPDTLRLLEVNLLQGDVVEHEASVERFNSADDFIIRTLEGMHRTIRDRPLSGLDPWTVETTQKPAACARCKFRSICARGKGNAETHASPRLL